MSSGQIAISGDGKRFINVRSGILIVRDVENGKAIQELNLPKGFGTGFASNSSVVSMSRDGRIVAHGGQSNNTMGMVNVYDVEKNESIFQAGLQHEGLPIPVLSPDGKFLATRRYQPVFTQPAGKMDPNAGRSVQVWEVDAGKELFTAVVPGSGTAVTGMDFTQDGKLLAISCGEGVIDVWDVATAKSRGTIFGRMKQGLQVAFSPDGKTLAAVATDGTIQRWNVADRKMIDATELSEKVPSALAQGLVFADNERVIAWGVAGLSPVVVEAPSGKVLGSAHTTNAIKCDRVRGRRGRDRDGRGRTSRIARNAMRRASHWGRSCAAPAACRDRGSPGGISGGCRRTARGDDRRDARDAVRPGDGRKFRLIPSSTTFSGFMVTMPSHDLDKAMTFANTLSQAAESCVVCGTSPGRRSCRLEVEGDHWD